MQERPGTAAESVGLLVGKGLCCQMRNNRDQATRGREAKELPRPYVDDDGLYKGIAS